MGLEELEYVQSGGPTPDELNKLDGCRVKIAAINLVDDVSRWKDNMPLPEGQEIAVKKIEIVTEEFGQDLIGRNIVHKERYNLKEKDGKWVVSLHEKSKTGQFLAKYGFEKFDDAIGAEVVLTKKTNPETKRSWLAISI